MHFSRYSWCKFRLLLIMLYFFCKKTHKSAMQTFALTCINNINIHYYNI